MNRITHDRIAKSLVPNLSRKTISKINSHIDNPLPIHYAIQNSYSTNTKKGGYNNPYDVLELGKKSYHRRTNHDFLSAGLAGYMASGSVDGIRAAMIHTMLDKMSDTVRDRFGAKYRNLWEAWADYNT